MNKIFRVFVSSTFTDMREERRILQEDVFPKLKKLCASKGTTFQDVDLRWGVSEESQIDHKTIDICLFEIARCQRLSPKPNFIILLGDKYGWQPIPSRIPSSEMELIFREIDTYANEIINYWYREDLNAVPPEFVLQPRHGKYLKYENWETEEEKILGILRLAVSALPFTDIQRIKYFASLTHQEILAGALSPSPDVIDPKEHVFAYFRTIKNLPENESSKEYIDIKNGCRDDYSKDQLKRLKQELKKRLPSEHVYSYEANWDNICVLKDKKAFTERIFKDLSKIINAQLEETIEEDPLNHEIWQHEEFKKQKLEHFTGRQEALRAIRDYLDSHGNKVFSIISTSGTGKTSLMARAMEEASDREGVTVGRFIGTTSATSDSDRLLSDIIREISRKYETDMNTLLKEGEDETRFSTLRGLEEIFPRYLDLATKEKPLFLFIDALDQLGGDHSLLNFYWLPRKLPENVKIIVSALPVLKEKLHRTATYDLGAMSEYEGAELLNRWLASVNRTLQAHQKKEVLEKFTVNGIPLFLKLIFENIKEWHSYSPNMIFGMHMNSALESFFDRLEKEHGRLLVQRVCGYLISGKNQGLMEEEILDLLVFDKKFWKYFVEHCHPNHRQEVQKLLRLPMVVWSRLFLDLEPYLTEREAYGFNIISFYHRTFFEYVRQRYLSKASSVYHSILADYFEKEPLYLDKNKQMPNVRKVVELPFQETLAEKWENITEKSIANFNFLMAKTKANLGEAIIDDYNLFWNRAPEPLKDALSVWQTFFKEHIRILRRGNYEWPAYKILLQIAIEHADNSPISIAAEQFAADGNCDWLWLRRHNRPPRINRRAFFNVVEEFSKGILEARDGRFLSWSSDDALRLWDKDAITITVLEGHAGKVNGALITKEGHFLSWSNDKTLRLWDEDGKPIAVLEGHAGEVNGALITKEGHFLSWSNDKTLRLWDKNANLISVLDRHRGNIRGVFETKDGRFLSWSGNKWDHFNDILCLWNRDGNLLPTDSFFNHLEIDGVLETMDGCFITWSGFHISIWDSEFNDFQNFTAKIPVSLAKKIFALPLFEYTVSCFTLFETVIPRFLRSFG